MVQVELVLLEPEKLSEVDAWRALLDDDERARLGRLRNAGDQLAFVAAHGLLRKLLSSRVADVAPSAWRFNISASGKPWLADTTLRFNLSHCRELVAVALTSGAELGVDVEPVNATLAGEDVARRVYGPAELADLAAQPTLARRVERFFERWTVKEAWVKATGVGLDDDLPAFEVRLAEGEATVERGDARPWQLRWWTPLPGVKLGLCVGTAQPLSVTPRWWRS